ncbi:MAG: hypothetical protein ABFS28_13630 [Bacteroidota bacterium]
MISPQTWMLKRPGIMLPVFFLSLFPVFITGQSVAQESSRAALGGTFVTGSGFMSACQNQAGLGWIEHHSLSLQHSRPFMELGVSVLAAQIKDPKGAWGTVFSTFGITGLRQSSVWLSYGMRLSPSLSAGLGMHFHTFSIPEKSFFHSGLDLALGLQTRISEHWVLGVHMATESSRQSMCISAGCAYSFFNTATCYSELHIKPGQGIQLANGLEWSLRKQFSLMLGISNLPLTWSAGVAVLRQNWVMHLAFQYVTENGSIPHSSLHYVW